MESHCRLVTAIQMRVRELLHVPPEDMCYRIVEVCRLLEGLLINMRGGKFDVSKILSRCDDLSSEKVEIKVEEVNTKNGLPLGHVQLLETYDHPSSDETEDSVPITNLYQGDSNINVNDSIQEKLTEESRDSDISIEENVHEELSEEHHDPFISDQENVPRESCKDDSEVNEECATDHHAKSSRSKRTRRILDNGDRTNCGVDDDVENGAKPKGCRKICPTCDQKIIKRHFEEHYGNCRVGLSKIKPCKKCGASFQTQKELKSHRRLCLQEVQCEKCHVKMKRELLQDHERKCYIHRLCEDCGVDRFLDMKSFKQHR